MMSTVYYYDDDSTFDHWRMNIFLTDEQAIAWGDALYKRWGGNKAILYKDATSADEVNFITVKEYNG